MTSLKAFILLVILYHGPSSAAQEYRTDLELNTIDMIESNGYMTETHYITTEDGYIITYHRIPRGIRDTSDRYRPAILLMHGLLSSSADFVVLGPNRSLGYLLADAGYDVWLANARGNHYSRRHTYLDAEENAREFFNFSWHEIGYFDLANAIDYILALKGDTGLYYVGHSQGTTAFFVLTSTRPEYNNKIKLAHMMAPSAIMEHTPSIILRILSENIDVIQNFLKYLRIYEVPFIQDLRNIGSACANPVFYTFCVIFGNLFGADIREIDRNLIPVFFANTPSTGASKQMYHYAQLIKNGGFRQFDYGPQRNMIIYGSTTPPDYDFEEITAPVALYYAINDMLQSPQDVRTIIRRLPHVVLDYIVPDESFGHGDFIFSRKVVDLVYKKMLQVMSKY